MLKTRAGDVIGTATAVRTADAAPRASSGPPEPATMKLWPDVGQRLGLSRNGTYDAARRGEIPTLRFGRVLRVPTAAFNRMLESGEQPGSERAP